MPLYRERAAITTACEKTSPQGNGLLLPAAADYLRNRHRISLPCNDSENRHHSQRYILLGRKVETNNTRKGSHQYLYKVPETGIIKSKYDIAGQMKLKIVSTTAPIIGRNSVGELHCNT